MKFLKRIIKKVVLLVKHQIFNLVDKTFKFFYLSTPKKFINSYFFDDLNDEYKKAIIARGNLFIKLFLDYCNSYVLNKNNIFGFTKFKYIKVSLNTNLGVLFLGFYKCPKYIDINDFKNYCFNMVKSADYQNADFAKDFINFDLQIIDLVDFIDVCDLNLNLKDELNNYKRDLLMFAPDSPNLKYVNNLIKLNKLNDKYKFIK